MTYYQIVWLQGHWGKHNKHYGTIASEEIMFGFHHDPEFITKIMIYNKYYSKSKGFLGKIAEVEVIDSKAYSRTNNARIGGRLAE
jgi:hypothetical protein